MHCKRPEADASSVRTHTGNYKVAVAGQVVQCYVDAGSGRAINLIVIFGSPVQLSKASVSAHMRQHKS